MRLITAILSLVFLAAPASATLVRIADGVPVPIPYTDPATGAQLPPNMEALWSAQELAAYGLKSIPNPPVAQFQVISTASPAINGAYPIDAAAQAKANAIAEYISVNGKFPGGVSALPWPDIGGVYHNFPTTTLFIAFASAMADYVTALTLKSSIPSIVVPAQPTQLP